MEIERLVLIVAAFDDNSRKVGTGYIVNANLILTANHVVSSSTGGKPIKIEVRREDDSTWLACESALKWESPQLDATLIKLETPVKLSKEIEWHHEPLSNNQNWSSTAYPFGAAETDHTGRKNYISKGLDGLIYAFGGLGQTSFSRLDLSVNAPPGDISNWQGISGAPVLLNGKLVGFIRSVPEKFSERLEGTPTWELFRDPLFVKELGRSYTDSLPLDDDYWTDIIIAENNDADYIVSPAKSAIKTLKDKNDDNHVFPFRIENILKTPGALLNHIERLCKAPIVIFDATGYQPGIMFLLGIRAVARRGLTIVTTSDEITPQMLSKLPFNIQEIKLLSLHRKSKVGGTETTAKDKLANAIHEGRKQLSSNPRFLDLPTYDAVRNPVVYDSPEIENKVLYLCSFKEEHIDNFDYIRNGFVDNEIESVDSNKVLRMLDIKSPQLVGQSLYEHIRWARLCIVDWTGWSPNVFYELGVRYTSSPIAPINVIEESDVSVSDLCKEQSNMLLNLFNPLTYSKEKKFPLEELNTRLKNIKNNSPKSSFDLQQMANDHIFRTTEKCFEWQQDGADRLPHSIIKKRIERSFGPDDHRFGQFRILYSANEEYKKALQKQRRELWLAAWFYYLNRFVEQGKPLDEKNRDEIIAIGESLLEVLDTNEFSTLKNEIVSRIDELEK